MGGIVDRHFRCAECSRCQKRTTPCEDVVADAQTRGWVFPNTDLNTVYCPVCILEMYNESQRAKDALSIAGGYKPSADRAEEAR